MYTWWWNEEKYLNLFDLGINNFIESWRAKHSGITELINLWQSRLQNALVSH